MAARKAKPVEPAPEPHLYTVVLDAESFHWFRDMLAAKKRYQYSPSYIEMVERTLNAFDEANGDEPPVEEPPAPPVRRRRRLAKPRGRD